VANQDKSPFQGLLLAWPGIAALLFAAWGLIAARPTLDSPRPTDFPTGQIGPAADGSVPAAVERKTLDDLATALSNGTLAFQLQRLAELPLAAIVVEARYAALYKLEHVDGSWLVDQLARLPGPLPRSPARLRRLPPLRRRLDLPPPRHGARRRGRTQPEQLRHQPGTRGESPGAPHRLRRVLSQWRFALR